MHSGIGPAQHLNGIGVPAIHDLPEVGKNLQDHVDVSVKFECTKPVSVTPAMRYPKRAWVGLQWMLFRNGLSATNHFEVAGYVRTGNGHHQHNIQYLFIPLLANVDGSALPQAHGYQSTVMLLRPRSRGSVTLKNPNSRHQPAIVYNYLDNHDDVLEIREGIQAPSSNIFSTCI